MGDCYAHRALRGHQAQPHDRRGGGLDQGRIVREGWSQGAQGGAASGSSQEASSGLLYSEVRTRNGLGLWLVYSVGI